MEITLTVSRKTNREEHVKGENDEFPHTIIHVEDQNVFSQVVALGSGDHTFGYSSTDNDQAELDKFIASISRHLNGEKREDELNALIVEEGRQTRTFMVGVRDQILDKLKSYRGADTRLMGKRKAAKKPKK